jgi:uncharacterized coiled-coil DUF342 family protein
MAQYKELQDEEKGVIEEIKRLKDALDSHTDENQAKRKALRDRIDAIHETIEALKKNIQQGQQYLQQLYQSLETNLALAEHCNTWSWKEASPDKPTL